MEEHAGYDVHGYSCFYHVKLPFPFKLHVLLDEMTGAQGCESVISWITHGLAFRVHRPKEFAKTVLPRYFKQSHYKSFQRQLNIYGFRRIKDRSRIDYGAYFHKKFIRGEHELALTMKRHKKVNYAAAPGYELPESGHCNHIQESGLHVSEWNGMREHPMFHNKDGLMEDPTNPEPVQLNCTSNSLPIQEDSTSLNCFTSEILYCHHQGLDSLSPCAQAEEDNPRSSSFSWVSFDSARSLASFEGASDHSTTREACHRTTLSTPELLKRSDRTINTETLIQLQKLVNAISSSKASNKLVETKNKLCAGTVAATEDLQLSHDLQSYQKHGVGLLPAVDMLQSVTPDDSGRTFPCVQEAHQKPPKGGQEAFSMSNIENGKGYAGLDVFEDRLFFSV